MKDEWKVFIQGVPGRGDEVIKALTDLGAKESFYTTSGSNEKFIHFINHKGETDYVCLDTEQAQIIMDNYSEIKLPEKQWRDGDILFSEADNEFAVFDEHLNSNKFFSYLSTCYAGYLTHQDIPKKDFRLATESEIEQFYERLHSIGKDWDAEKKQLVDWKWKPKYGDMYWIINIDGYVKAYIWNEDSIDNRLFNLGNYFRTRKEAETMVEKINKLLNE